MKDFWNSLLGSPGPSRTSWAPRIKQGSWNFPSGPEVGTLPSNEGGVGLILGQGARIFHASGPKTNKQTNKQKTTNPKHKTEAILYQIQ